MTQEKKYQYKGKNGKRKPYSFTISENLILKLNQIIGYDSRSKVVEKLISDFVSKRPEDRASGLRPKKKTPLGKKEISLN